MAVENRKSELGAMPELTEFDVTHLAMADLVFLNASFKDMASGVAGWTTVEFPDQKIVMRRDKAEELMTALKRAIDYVDAGIEHPNSRFFDDD